MDKNYLFVSGCGRSGTGLVARILGFHPSIVMGIERYMGIFGKNFSEFKPELFTFGRYFDFRPKDGKSFARGISADTEGYYKRMKDKWSISRYVGDKIPTLFMRFDEIHKRFFPAKIIHITRYIDDVVCSWDALVRSGRLPPAYDCKRAINVWNAAMVKALQYKRAHPDNISLIDYGRIYDDGSINKMLRSIDKDLDSEPINKFVEIERLRAPIFEKQRSKRILTEKQRKYIDKYARFDLYKECVSASVFQKV